MNLWASDGCQAEAVGVNYTQAIILPLGLVVTREEEESWGRCSAVIPMSQPALCREVRDYYHTRN